MAAGIVVFIWIYNVAFNIPMFMFAGVYKNNWSNELNCYPKTANPIYVLVARIINFFVPLIMMWASYIGIIYKLKRSMNKAMFMFVNNARQHTACIDLYQSMYVANCATTKMNVNKTM